MPPLPLPGLHLLLAITLLLHFLLDRPQPLFEFVPQEKNITIKLARLLFIVFLVLSLQFDNLFGVLFSVFLK